MTISEYKTKYDGLTSAQVRKLSTTSSEFVAETEALYKMAYKASINKSCNDCWVDAYVLLMKADPAAFDALVTRQFDLRAGALLLDIVGGDNAKMCTRKNLTDELAIYHLRNNPGYIKFFSRYPDNWKELVTKAKKAEAAKKAAEAKKKKKQAEAKAAEETERTDATNDVAPVEVAEAEAEFSKATTEAPEETMAETEATEGN